MFTNYLSTEIFIDPESSMKHMDPMSSTQKLEIYNLI